MTNCVKMGTDQYCRQSSWKWTSSQDDSEGKQNHQWKEWKKNSAGTAKGLRTKLGRIKFSVHVYHACKLLNRHGVDGKTPGRRLLQSRKILLCAFSFPKSTLANSSVEKKCFVDWYRLASLPLDLDQLPLDEINQIPNFAKISFRITSGCLSARWSLAEVGGFNMTMTLSTEENPPQNGLRKKK